MTITIRKCDFCGKEIHANLSHRTMITALKSYEEERFSEKEYDICHNCTVKMFNCLNGNSETSGMSDEELAEQYAEKHKEVDWEGFNINKNDLKKGFLAGLKANRPKWHDLRENPDDLPKETICVLTLFSDDGLEECTYIPNEGFKNPAFSTWCCPIAWIEKEKILPNL